MNTRQLQTDKNQKLYHALLGILLVCALAMMMLLSYWACKYSYYGAVDGRTRGVLVGDKTWAHIAVFLAASLCAMGIDKVLMKKDKSQQEKICLCTLIVTSVIAFMLGVFYVCKNPYYPVGRDWQSSMRSCLPCSATLTTDRPRSFMSYGGYLRYWRAMGF